MMFSNKITKTIRDVMLYSDTRIATLLCSVSYFGWGFFLLLPGEVLNRPFYKGLYIISTNENLWGSLFLILAIIRCISLAIERPSKFWTAIFYISKLFGCFLSSYIFLTATVQPISPPASADTFVIAFLAWWEFARNNRVPHLITHLTSKIEGG